MAPHGWISQDFPPKHLFSCEGAKLEDRRHGLERRCVFPGRRRIGWVQVFIRAL